MALINGRLPFAEVSFADYLAFLTVLNARIN
jgi:hypothetical protein